MTTTVAALLFGGAGVGILLCVVQLLSVRRHLALCAPAPSAFPGISILKPLCGHDDDLCANLELFALLPYPDYELLLGVRSRDDAAYPAACAAQARFPGRVRVVVQRGEPGMNPKVNQLITLARAARHDILVVSDSNVQVERDYLAQIAAYLEDPRVGLVTHAVVGIGETRLGSLLDNLHLAADVGAGMIGAKRIAGKDLVVGKSMAMRRRDLAEVGGFESVEDILAEDYVLGKKIAGELRKRVVMAHRPVYNVSRQRSVRDFLQRYRRWSVIHCMAVGPAVYACGLILNPIVLAIAGAAVGPSVRTLSGVGLACALKVAVDGATVRALRGRLPVKVALAVPLKDLLLALVWLHGLVHRTVEWRGNPLRVRRGTRLERPSTEATLVTDI